MKDILEQEITGSPVTVLICGRSHELAYPMHNVIVYKRCTGDSLFDVDAWPRIDLTEDPERWLACLWAGLHLQMEDKSWKAPYTIEELGALVDFRNAGEISSSMVKALTRYLPKPDPKAPAPGEPAPEASQTRKASPISTSSGVELAAVSASAAMNS